jgi:hypothetical protein
MHGMPQMVFVHDECTGMENPLVETTSDHCNVIPIIAKYKATAAIIIEEEYAAYCSACAPQV